MKKSYKPLKKSEKFIRKLQHRLIRFFTNVKYRYFLILCLLTLIFLPAVCSSLRDSFFYVKSKNRAKAKKTEQNVNDARIKNGRKEIDLLENNFEFNQTRKDINIGFTIISISRDRHRDPYSPKYLTQVVGKLLYLLKTYQHSKTYQIFLCNVDADPDTFDEIKNLTKYFVTFQRFANKTSIPYNKFEKEKQDYLYCLQETMKRNVTYTFLIEDDAYPNDALLNVLEHVLETRIENKFSNSRILHRNVTYIKFYHIPRVLGYYSIEIERIPELIGLSLFFGTIFCLIYIYFVKQSRSRIYLFWFLFIAYVCLVSCAIGRQNLLELRRLSKFLYFVTPTPSCCTPANLFTRYGGATLIDLMSKIPCKAGYAKDTLLDDLRRKHNLIGLMVQPNLFKHIGLYTTLRGSISIDPYLKR